VAVIDLLKALFSIEVDLTSFEAGTAKAERQAEVSSKKISGSFSGMGVAIAAGLGASVIPMLERFIGKIEQSVKETAQWGLEMEHMGARMGLTATQAATLVGVMERFGINAGIGARSLQILAMQIHQTNAAMDPFQTKLGKVLGSLRDTHGAALNMSQVFDLARQKVGAAGSEMEKLQVAQQMVGARMGGQLLPVLKLSNEEWAKVSESVVKAQGDVEAAAAASLAYKQASTELDQTLRGISVSIGTALLPKISEYIHYITEAISWTKEFSKAHPGIAEAASPFAVPAGGINAINQLRLGVGEFLGVYSKGTLEIFNNYEKILDAARKANLEKEKANEADQAARELAEKEIEDQQKLAQLAHQRLQALEKLYKLGAATLGEVEIAREQELLQLEQQRVTLQERLRGEHGGIDEVERQKLEQELLQNRLRSVEIVSQKTKEMYANEELQLKANGALSLSTELQLLERKVSDEKIVGEERLKIEAEVYQKRKQFQEEIYKVGRQLGALSVQDEIQMRKARAAEALGKGDITGAASEIVKVRDLAIKQADEEMAFVKKLRMISLQDEIDFQKQKLEAVKGNAEEEMKVISQIADLDKQQYEKRLELALNYTKTVVDSYQQMVDASKKGGEEMTFAQARREAERKLVEESRQATSIAGGGGGTQAQRDWATQWAQMITKQVTDMQIAGKEVSGTMREAANAAKDVLKSAAGGEEVRAPGGPSPVVGSILSSTEGLATQGLARGSDIPRLDTSFTDLAVRIRDVILGAIPNIQSFSSALAAATKMVTGSSGNPINLPPALGPGQIRYGAGSPGEASPTGAGTPAQPAYGLTPSYSGGGGYGTVGGVAFDQATARDLTAAIKSLNDRMENAFAAGFADAVSSSVAEGVTSALGATPLSSRVDVGIDPGTGDLMAQVVENTVVKALR
jgi:hypothetical protein